MSKKNSRPSILDGLIGTPQSEKQVKAKKAAEVIEQKGIQVDREIEKNPLYAILHSDKSDAEIIEELGTFLTRNPEESAEENMKKIAYFTALNTYYQEKIIDLAKDAAEFTNDDAFSLFDDAVDRLQGRLQNFQGSIRPIVSALQVIKKAEDAGEDPMEMIQQVQAQQEHHADLERQLARRGLLKDGQKLSNEAITSLSAKIDRLNAEEADAQSSFDNADTEVTRIQSKRLVWNKQDKLADAKLDRTRAEIDLRSVRGEIGAQTATLNLAHELLRSQEELAGNPQLGAIDKLLVITGKDYRSERGNLVENVQKFIDEAREELGKARQRFHDGAEEVQKFSNSSDNIMAQYMLVLGATKNAYEATDAILKADEAKRDEMREAEAGQQIPSPALARLEKATSESKEYLSVFLPTRDSAVHFNSTLAKTKGEMTALRAMLLGKRHDAEELRTNGAVAVATQLVTTLKALEGAIAGQKVGIVRDQLKSMFDSAREASQGIYDTVLSDQVDRNTRLGETLQSLAEVTVAIDEITDEMLHVKTDEAGLTEAVVEAGKRVSDAAENFKSVASDARRMGQEKVTPEAASGLMDHLENAARARIAEEEEAEQIISEQGEDISNDDENMSGPSAQPAPGGMG